MNAQLTAQLKQAALDAGADLVGIGSLDRYEGAPPHADARLIFPEAQSIIALAFRIPRGYFRGNEEGTMFYQYPAMGYANINEVFAPAVVRRVACTLEDHGYEGVPVRNFGGTNLISDMTGDPDESVALGRRLRHSRPVRPGQPAPDIFIHFRIAAFVCGLGEIGFSKVFLTPEFGPRQRFAFLLTDAPLKPDPLYDGPQLCDKCLRCVADCPGALTAKESVKVTVAGRELEWSKLDEWHCFFAYASGLEELNPFLPADAFDDMPDGPALRTGQKRPTPEQVREIQARLGKYFPLPNGYFPAMCAGRGCMRACMIHLEERGVLTRGFRSRFRKRPPWWRNAAAAQAGQDDQ